MAKKRKGNWLGMLIVGTAVLVYVYLSEQESQTNTVANQAPVIDNFGTVERNAYGLNAVRDDWPKLADASVITMSSSMTQAA
ncbi:MAG: hypothetical protein P8163_18280 [Candidatus Thiodiazotropha sp.]